MIKILGLLSVFICATLTGVFMYQRLNERTEVLKETKTCAVHIKNEIEYRHAPLDECFKGRGRLFSNAYKLIKQSELSPKDAIKTALKPIEAFSLEDRLIISTFAENLSCEDLKGQIANLEIFIASLNENIKQSTAESANKGKLFCYGGVLAGLGLVIILL